MPSAGWWLLGILAHNIFPRAFALAEIKHRQRETNIEVLLPLGAVELGTTNFFDRDELRQRRQAGESFLTSPEEVFFLTVNLVIMRPLDRITLGSMKACPEDRKITSNDVPEWGAMLDRVSKAFAKYESLLDAELPGGWAILELFTDEVIPEEWCARVRQSILHIVAELFIRFVMAFYNSPRIAQTPVGYFAPSVASRGGPQGFR